MNDLPLAKLEFAIKAYRKYYGSREREFFVQDDTIVSDLTDSSSGTVIECEDSEVAACIAAALDLVASFACISRPDTPFVNERALAAQLKLILGERA